MKKKFIFKTGLRKKTSLGEACSEVVVNTVVTGRSADECKIKIIERYPDLEMVGPAEIIDAGYV